MEDNNLYLLILGLLFYFFIYFIRKSNFIIRFSICFLVWFLLLQLPFYFHLSYGTVSTLMISVLCFCIPLKITEILILNTSKQRKQQTFIEYNCEFLFFIFMLRKGPKNRNERHSFIYCLLYFIIIIITVFIKLQIAILVMEYLYLCIGYNNDNTQIQQDKLDNNYSILLYYNSLWSITILTGMWMYDILEALIPLLTFDYFRYGPFNNWVLLSTSIQELWGKRYNLLISGLLKTSVFYPMKRYLHVPNSIAALSSFMMSGILHMYVIYITFGPGYEIKTFIFFLMHAIACIISVLVNSFFKPSRNVFSLFPKILSIIITFSFLLVTLPMYTRPLIIPSMLGNDIWAIIPVKLGPYLYRISNFGITLDQCI